MTNKEANIIIDVYEELKTECKIERIDFIDNTINVYTIPIKGTRTITLNTGFDYENLD